ncbi:MAG TPA: S4 domain-containing protein, partial [Candidatus Binatia bacterium]|nr:S4 domain-containing protein [Candidatus Binatia bacterium]
MTVLTVEPASAGARLDRWLSDRLPDLSRARLQALIRGGLVRVDGVVLKAAHRLRGGERIEIEIPPPPDETLVPESVPLSVVYED